jgi:HSP20 family protein
MERDIDRIFDSLTPASFFRGTSPVLRHSQETRAVAPAIDMFEKEGNIIVKAELPGLKKEDVKVELKNDVLSIVGESKQEKDYHEGEAHIQERSFGRFWRQVALPEGASPDKISAKFEDGVLKVVIPKEESKPAQQILIE